MRTKSVQKILQKPVLKTGIHSKIHVMRPAYAMHLDTVLVWGAPYHAPGAGKFHQGYRIRTKKDLNNTISTANL